MYKQLDRYFIIDGNLPTKETLTFVYHPDTEDPRVTEIGITHQGTNTWLLLGAVNAAYAYPSFEYSVGDEYLTINPDTYEVETKQERGEVIKNDTYYQNVYWHPFSAELLPNYVETTERAAMEMEAAAIKLRYESINS